MLFILVSTESHAIVLQTNSVFNMIQGDNIGMIGVLTSTHHYRYGHHAVDNNNSPAISVLHLYTALVIIAVAVV